MLVVPGLPVVNTTLAQVGIDPAVLDRTADPCDDFFQFACGGWLAATKIPDDEGGIQRGFEEIADKNALFLRDVLAAPAPGDDIERPLRTFYAACTDTTAIEKAGLRALQPLRTVIANVRDARSLSTAVATLHRAGVETLFAYGATQDAKNATMVIAEIDQGGMGLPDRDYYLSTDQEMADARTAYTTYVAGLLAAAGRTTATKDAAAVLALETELARVARPIEELREPQKLYNRLDRTGVVKAAPSFDWAKLWLAAGQTTDAVNVGAPHFLVGIEKLIKTTPGATWRAYLTAHLFSTLAPHLPAKIDALSFAFAQELTGVTAQKPRWRRCVDAAMELAPDLVGQVFVRAKFGPGHKAAMQAQIAAITNAMQNNIERLSWMDTDTRTRAITKLASMKSQIGYPDAWIPFRAKLQRVTHTANVLATMAADARRDFARIGKPDDARHWDGESAAVVNAFYDPARNNMLFPAGTLQPPVFALEASIAVNMGSMGATVGHELTHGFDDEGSQYDERGNLDDWWKPATRAEFARRTTCVVDQYAEYATAGKKVNGVNTLGENIADIGGTKLAFNAYRAMRSSAKEAQIADGFTEDQQFFISFGQSWCAKLRLDMEAMLQAIDVHAPAQWRVNGTVASLPSFATAFRCKAGSKLAPVKACSVW